MKSACFIPPKGGEVKRSLLLPFKSCQRLEEKERGRAVPWIIHVEGLDAILGMERHSRASCTLAEQNNLQPCGWCWWWQTRWQPPCLCPSYPSSPLVTLHSISQDCNTWTGLENVGWPASHPLKSHGKEAVANLVRRLGMLGRAASLDECLPTCFFYASHALFLASFQAQLNLWQIIIGRVVSRVNNTGIRYFFFWHQILKVKNRRKKNLLTWQTPQILTICLVVSHLLGASRGFGLGFVCHSLGEFGSQLEWGLVSFLGWGRRSTASTYCSLGAMAAVEITAFWRGPGGSVWEAAGLRCIKQVGGIPKAGLEAVFCAAKEVNQRNSDGQSLLEFSGLS